MNSVTPDLSLWQVGLGGALFLGSVGLYAAFSLGLTRRMLWSSLRMSIQLAFAGLVLEWVFRQKSGWLVILILLFMGGVAAYTAARRSPRRFRGLFLDSLVAILAGGFFATSFMILGIIQPEWSLNPQIVIPISGMIFGNALNGITLSTDTFLDRIVRDRPTIETALALGATRLEALRGLIQLSLRTGLTPLLNTMTVMGIVSLPGMMTGQILGGATPMTAVAYQATIMFMIAVAVQISSLLLIAILFFRFTHAAHRLSLERITRSNAISA